MSNEQEFWVVCAEGEWAVPEVVAELDENHEDGLEIGWLEVQGPFGSRSDARRAARRWSNRRRGC